MTPKGPGARINIPVDIPEDGQYELIGLIAQAPDYGDYKALLDDQPMNLDPRQAATSEVPFPGPEIFYNYLPEVYVAKDRALGMATLTKGRHTLSFICMGKDPHSLGYKFGINDVVIEKMQDLSKETAADTISEPAHTKTGSEAVYRGQPVSSYLAQVRKPDSHAETFRAIGSFGSEGVPALPQLVQGLQDPDFQVKMAAAWAISQIGPVAKVGCPISHIFCEKWTLTAVKALTLTLSDADSRVRSLSAVALGQIGPSAASAVPQLNAALDDPVAFVRAPAADALGEIGPAAKDGVDPLSKRLLVKDEPSFVLRSISYALGNIGPDARAALPALEETLKSVRAGYAAQSAILKIKNLPLPSY